MSGKPKQPEMKLVYEESCDCCMKNEDAISTFIMELSLYNCHRMYVDDHMVKVKGLEARISELELAIDWLGSGDLKDEVKLREGEDE